MASDKVFNVKNLKKKDLFVVAEKIRVIVTPELKIKDLKERILGSDEFKNNPGFIANFLVTTIQGRIQEINTHKLTCGAGPPPPLPKSKVSLDILPYAAMLKNRNL